ncbi:ethionine resistance [Fusarium sporotrichioides]|uniref:Ethionine resistance n=1 Tax=Fusarium sporotrichioides TaxID=5514 RepID=A0A395S594_FUSSP|nr:ethionine resistance [Fusarium sporotrichioides]
MSEILEEPDRNEAAPLLADSESGNTAEWPTNNWYTELSLIARYTIPLVATYLLQYSFSVITTTTAGHLSPDDLAAAAIGVTTMTIGGLALYEGMATALDTLCAQAYGSGNKTGVGLHVQRMLLLMTIVTIPVAIFWISSPAFLTLILRQDDLAAKAGSFLRVSILGIPGYASFEALKRLLQAQGDFNTAMLVLVVCAPVNALLSWLFAFRLNMGLEGAALGAAVANTLRPILLLLCIFFKKSTHQCWPGFTMRAFQGWGPMVRLSAAGSTVTLAEWAVFEIITVSTSYMGTIHLAAQTILTTTSIVMWHIPFSLGVAVSTRIGHLIGAGHVQVARRTTILYGILFVTLGVMNGTILLSLRNYIGPFYTDDDAVRRVVADTMFAVAAFQLVDSIICGCSGILRGLAKQSVAAWVVFIVNYLAAVPIALWLELGPLHLGLNGVWSGIIGGDAVIAAVEIIYMIRLDWRQSVEVVKTRED